jgi:hypothetical protein
MFEEKLLCVSIYGVVCVLFDLFLGTVQLSILGPMLYAIYVSSLFDLECFLAFENKNFIPKNNLSKTQLITDMAKALEATTKRLKQSGLKVNNTNSELCLFYKPDVAPVLIRIVVLNNLSAS